MVRSVSMFMRRRLRELHANQGGLIIHSVRKLESIPMPWQEDRVGFLSTIKYLAQVATQCTIAEYDN